MATDDNLEIKLRRLSSFVYETRTGDRVGAASMLAIQPPGAGLDLAPSWLVTDATAHSKAEFQRSERVAKTRSSSDSAGSGKGGGKGSDFNFGGGGSQKKRGRGGGRGGKGRGGLPQR